MRAGHVCRPWCVLLHILFPAFTCLYKICSFWKKVFSSAVIFLFASNWWRMPIKTLNASSCLCVCFFTSPNMIIKLKMKCQWIGLHQNFTSRFSYRYGHPVTWKLTSLNMPWNVNFNLWRNINQILKKKLFLRVLFCWESRRSINWPMTQKVLVQVRIIKIWLV
jgi:hypothetical protein